MKGGRSVDWMKEIIKRLEERFPIQSRHHIRDAFPLLIATILSQNTSSRNSSQAFQNLQSEYEVTPRTLSVLQPTQLEPLIKVAGLYRIRSKRIIEVSKTVLERFGGDLEWILGLPKAKAREKLMSLEGVGPKTADIVLAFSGGRAIMPVDTNIFRVSQRIGLMEGRRYERTQDALEKTIPEERLGEMHFSLIRLGREICKPRRPLCPSCPINDLCAYNKKKQEGG